MKKRHSVLGFLTILSLITYLDRLCIAVAGPRMQEELGISPERWGWVLGVFLLSYGAFEIPTGALGDRVGQRKVLTRIVIWWSAFTALTGAVSNYWLLLTTRFLFGAGEAGAYPNASGSIARWFPAVERARAQGLVWGASRVGGALAPVLVVPIQLSFGWRASFWLFGAIGVVWAVLWWRWYHDSPREQPGMTQEELAEIGNPAPLAHGGVPWKRLFGHRQMWLIASMYWCYVWGSWFYLSWFHTFLVRGRGFSESEMAVWAPLPFVMGAAGNVAGGVLSDRISRRYGLRAGRVRLGATCLALSSLFLFAAALSSGKLSVIVLLALGFGVMDCMLPAAWALCLDIGGEHAGAVTGAMNSSGQFGGFVCSVVFGHLVQHYGDYNTPILLIAVMVMVAAVLFRCIDPARPLVIREQEPVRS
jgi:MFS family permease